MVKQELDALEDSKPAEHTTLSAAEVPTAFQSQMVLPELLEQHNKKRLAMARQEQENSIER